MGWLGWLGAGALSFACDYGPKEPPGTSVFPAGLPGHTFGLVLDDGERVPNARVLLGEAASFVDIVDGGTQDAVQTTDARGLFDFRGFGRPGGDSYDVTVRNDGTRPQDVAHFVGVERYFGAFSLFGGQPRRGWSSRLEVALEPIAEGATVAYFASGLPIGGTKAIGNGMELVWTGSYQTRIDVHALAYVADPVTKLPVRYVGYAREPLSFTHGGVTSWSANLVPLESAESTIVLEERNAAGVAFQDVGGSVSLDFGEMRASLAIANLAAGTTRFLAPAIDGARLVLRAQATSDAGTSRIVRVFGVGGEPQTFGFVRGSRLTEPPAEGATVTPESVFRWEFGAGTARLVIDAGEAGRVAIVTAQDEARLPSRPLALLGVELPEGTPATVTLQRYPGLKGIDAFVAPIVPYDYVDVSESVPFTVVLGR